VDTSGKAAFYFGGDPQYRPCRGRPLQGNGIVLLLLLFRFDLLLIFCRSHEQADNEYYNISIELMKKVVSYEFVRCLFKSFEVKLFALHIAVF
jgi:hypothetical protein